MMETVKQKKSDDFPFSILEAYMKRAGITSGYQTKPCLDPTDPRCPETAPNKQSQEVIFEMHSSVVSHNLFFVVTSEKCSFVPAEKVTKHLFFRS